MGKFSKCYTFRRRLYPYFGKTHFKISPQIAIFSHFMEKKTPPNYDFFSLYGKPIQELATEKETLRNFWCIKIAKIYVVFSTVFACNVTKIAKVYVVFSTVFAWNVTKIAKVYVVFSTVFAWNVTKIAKIYVGFGTVFVRCRPSLDWLWHNHARGVGRRCLLKIADPRRGPFAPARNTLAGRTRPSWRYSISLKKYQRGQRLAAIESPVGTSLRIPL